MQFVPPTVLFVLSIALAWLISHAFRLQGTWQVVICGSLVLLGAAAAALAWRFRGSFIGSPLGKAQAPDTSDEAQLAQLLRDAEMGLSTAQRASVRTLQRAPLVYVLGPGNAAKTTAVLHSGMEPELLAGQVFRDGVVIPTPLANGID